MKGYSYRINKNWFSLSFANGTDEKHGWMKEISGRIMKY